MRLFFHTRERGRFDQDDVGAEFAPVEAARVEAVLSAREMMAARIVEGRPINDISFEISDAEGLVLLSFPWEDALVRV